MRQTFVIFYLFISLFISLLKFKKSKNGKEFFNFICVTIVIFPEQALGRDLRKDIFPMKFCSYR